MGDQLAAFFALPPSRVLVGGPPQGGCAAAPGPGAVRPGAAAAARGAGFAGRGRGRGAGAGDGVWTARSRANAWIQRASAASADGAAPDRGTAAGDGRAAAPAAQSQQAVAVSAPPAKGGAAARGGRGGGTARGAKKGGAPPKGAGSTAPAKTPQREMLWDGNNVGKLPNVMWRAVSMEDLRLHPHFVGLPEPHNVTIETAMDYRQFRQGSKEWCLLHDGRLTTSRMAPILGIYEPAAASKLGVPRSLSGHHKVMEAYFHLTRPPCSRADLEAASAEAPRAPAAGAAGDGGGPRGAVLATEPMTRGQRRRARGKAKQQGAQAAGPQAPAPAAAPAGGGGGGGGGGGWRRRCGRRPGRARGFHMCIALRSRGRGRRGVWRVLGMRA